MSIKMLREALCRSQANSPQWPTEVSEAVNNLIKLIDSHRPLGSDGKHGNRHTLTCGCEDR